MRDGKLVKDAALTSYWETVLQLTNLLFGDNAAFGLEGGGAYGFVDHYDINAVLKHYGFESREKQLFPSRSSLDVFNRVVSYISAIFDPSGSKWTPVVGVGYELSKDLAANDLHALTNVSLKALMDYENNLRYIKNDLRNQIIGLLSSIDMLKKNNVTGFNNWEIKSRTHHLWDLQLMMYPVISELSAIRERKKKGFKDKSGPG